MDLLIIFLAQVVYVSTMTLRWIILLKGNRVAATIMSFFEVGIWVYALSLVVNNIEEPLRLAVYAGGYAAGTALGSWLEERLAYGYSMVMAVAPEDSKLGAQLRKRGFAVTSWQGEGRDSRRRVLLVLYRRSFHPVLQSVVDEVEPGTFLLSLEPRIARGGFLVRRLPALPVSAEDMQRFRMDERTHEQS